MRLNHHIVIALSVLLSFSCNQKAKIEVVTELTETQEAVTKADTPTVLEGEFDFSVRDKDIWAYIERQKDFPRVLSIEPRVREGDTLMFIANLEHGWKIFSADKHLPPIVAEIPVGSFEQKTLDNPGLRIWMSSMMNLTQKIRQEKQISSATDYTDLWEGYPVIKKNAGETKGVKGLSSDPTWTRVIVSQQTSYQEVATHGPFLETKWGQLYPWNFNLPWQLYVSYPTGCVTVAVSQLLYYYHNKINCPSGLYHGISITSWDHHSATTEVPEHYTTMLSRTNYQNTSSRWGQMVKDTTEYNSNYPTSFLGLSYVSDLMVDVGNRTSTKYYADGSASVSCIENAQSALTSFGLSSTHATFCEPNAYQNIVNEKPLYIRAANISQVDTVAHAWVVDGAKKYQFVTQYTYQWWMGYLVGSLPNGEEMTQQEAQAAAWEIGLDKPEDGMITYGTGYSSDSYYRFHMNWGWYGENDGYYYITDYVGIENQLYQFMYNLQMLYNIHANPN